MPTTSIEMMGDRSASQNGSEFTATRAFHVQGAAAEMDVFGAFGDGTLPQYNDEHPSIRGMYVQDTSVNLVAGHPDLWKVKVVYKPFKWQLTPNPEDPLVPGTPGYIDFTANTHGTFENQYRENAVLETVGFGEGLDIGGPPTCPGGEPISVPRLKIDFVMTVTEQMGDIPWGDIQATVGKRNEAEFQALTAEYVVYLGSDAQRIDVGTVRVSHKFQYDAFKHLVQVPGRDNAGNTVQEEGSMCKWVNHVQPFPKMADFNILSKWFE